MNNYKYPAGSGSHVSGIDIPAHYLLGLDIDSDGKFNDRLPILTLLFTRINMQ